jgi:hypothetical protein
MAHPSGRFSRQEDRMKTESPEVDEFLNGLAHPMKDGILDLRAAILASDQQISEHVKWNAPSFCYHGDDRVTFRLQPGDRLQLVFHRGAKVRADSDDFTFEDDTGLLEWASPDRAAVTLRDLEDAQEKLPTWSSSWVAGCERLCNRHWSTAVARRIAAARACAMWASGWTKRHRWVPRSMVRRSAPGIFAAAYSLCRGGTSMSALPLITRVGVRIFLELQGVDPAEQKPVVLYPRPAVQ